MKSPRQPPQKSKGQGHDANRTGFTSESSKEETRGESSHSKRRATEDPNPGSKKRVRLASKQLQKAQPRKKPTMKELCVDWNRSAQIGLNTEMARGWLKTGERKWNQQGRLLRRAIPGAKALQEIKHYQRCQAFLVPQLPFHRLVREICDNEPLCTRMLRWQANALFTLQCATEAYVAGFLMDVNLWALHRRVVTIDRKDIWLAIQIRGREHVGGKRYVSDTRTMNPSSDWMSDLLEKKGLQKQRGCHFEYQSTPLADWNKDLWQSAKIKAIHGGKGGKGPFKRHRLVRDNLRAISKAAIARLARRGGVKRMSGLIYNEIRGVMKMFLEFVVQDTIIYTNYCECRTVTIIDVIYVLKCHGHNLYDFTRP